MPKLSGTIKLHIWITNTLNTLELAQCKHSVSKLLLKTPPRLFCEQAASHHTLANAQMNFFESISHLQMLLRINQLLEGERLNF